MTAKIPSEIVRIDLTDASYKDAHTYIEPTYVNFFFGNNGTGKSTIARAIKSGAGISYASGRTSADYLPLVYDQEFIDENFRSYRNMKGVFTLNARNAAIQQQIEEKTEERASVQKALTAATEKRDKTATVRSKLQRDFYKDCWDREKALREEFAKTQSGKGKSEPFTREILKHTPQGVDIEELRRLYDSAYSDTAKRYPRFATIADTSVLDTLEGCDILTTAIVNSADTELAGFLRGIGATEWMRQGHEEYSHQAGEKCPYCGQGLPADFEQIFIDSFDTRYQDNLRRLDAFLTLYKQKANNLFVPLQNLPSEVYPQIDTKPYTDKLAVLKAAIQSNIEAIKAKTENPASTAALSDISPILDELADIIKNFNALIDANNAIVDAGPKKRNECTDLVFSLLAFHLKDVIAAYQQSDTEMQKELDGLETEIKKHTEDLENIKKEFAGPRRTRIEDGKEAVYEEAPVEAQETVFVMDRFGYCKILDKNTYERNRETVDGEYKYVVPTMNTDKLCVFTDKGNLHQVKITDIPSGKLRDKGTPLDNVSKFDGGKENIVWMSCQEAMAGQKLLFATKLALVKLTPAEEFVTNNRTVACTKLSEGDEVVVVRPVGEETEVVLQTSEDIFLRFAIGEIPEMKKNARGVRGIKLAEQELLEQVYFVGEQPVITYKKKEVHLNRLKMGKRDGKGSKVRG